MQSRKFSIGTLLERLGEIDRWLGRLGTSRAGFDRLHQITRLVQLTEDARLNIKRQNRLPIIGDFENYIYAMAEALEFCQIYEAFNQAPSDVIGPKMRRVLEGPFRLTDETKTSNVGRNTAFELALAAEWKLRGADVRIGEPDITLRIGETAFLVECKRPLRIESVRTNLRAARDQLASKLNEASTSSVGLVAISMSRIFTGGASLFRAKSERDVDILSQQLESFLDGYKHEWFGLRMDSRIGAVLFHLSIPTDVGEHDHFALLSTSNLYQATNEGSHLEVLNHAMAGLYSQL